jgi:hypothetical protein
MTDFYIYLAEKRIKETERQKKIEQYYKKKEESGGGSSPSRKSSGLNYYCRLQ